MIPPITHYKDEVDDNQATMDVLNQELDKEVSAKEASTTQVPETKVELKVLPVEKKQQKTQPVNSSNIVNAFRQKMSLNTTSVELPSAGKTVEFKDIDGGVQKELSRVAMENNSRSDIMYCAMLAMINKLAMEKGFDIRDYTEFERIAITLNLQQMNKMNPEIKFTCPQCNKENTYRLDTMKLLKNFNKTYKTDTTVELEAGNRKFTFTIGWSSVKNVEDFFKNYFKKYDNYSKTGKETINNLSQVEYITMFIKKVSLSDINDPDDVLTANLEELRYPDRVAILDSLPQAIIFDEDTGVLAKVVETFVNPLNDVFKYRDCEFCGAEQSGTMANVTDFMGY